ncbi:hypothetical protein B0H14DRAFT_2567825 [Mycena olivaceomarginata]|nr:hypothetical protein B0H14DRAFT_2567825 [Mycena olivaceomarginata]
MATLTQNTQVAPVSTGITVVRQMAPFAYNFSGVWHANPSKVKKEEEKEKRKREKKVNCERPISYFTMVQNICIFHKSLILHSSPRIQELLKTGNPLAKRRFAVSHAARNTCNFLDFKFTLALRAHRTLTATDNTSASVYHENGG